MEFNSGFKGLNMLHTLRFFLQNSVYFVMLPFLVPVLFTFYIQGVLKFKCKTPVPKGSVGRSQQRRGTHNANVIFKHY